MLKKMWGLSLVSVALVGTLVVGLSGHSQASNDEAEATKNMNAYFKAMQTQDVESAMQYTIDLRYPNDDVKRERYGHFVEYAKRDNAKHKIVSLEKVDGTHMKAEVELTLSGQSQVVTIPLQKDDGEWKFLIDGSVTIKATE